MGLLNMLRLRFGKQPERKKVHRCPCCGFRTLSERGMYEICPVCFWEDDGQDDRDAEIVRGGPNYELSLTQARQHFREFGASSRRVLQHVREPSPDELL